MKRLLLIAISLLACVGASAQIVTSTTRIAKRANVDQFYAGAGAGIGGDGPGAVFNAGWIRSNANSSVIWGAEAGFTVAEILLGPYVVIQGGIRADVGNVVFTPRIAIGPSINLDHDHGITAMACMAKASAGIILNRFGVDAIFYHDFLDEDEFLIGAGVYYLF